MKMQSMIVEITMKTKLLLFSAFFSVICFVVYGQSSSLDSSAKIARLEKAMVIVLKKNKELEARIAKLESTPSATAKGKKINDPLSILSAPLTDPLNDTFSDVSILRDDISQLEDDLDDFLGIGWNAHSAFDEYNTLEEIQNALKDIQRELRMKADGLHFH